MNGDDPVCVLAYVPAALKNEMEGLPGAVYGVLTACNRSEEFIRFCKSGSFSVVLLPADLPTHDWLIIWGEVTSAEPRPSILVFSLKSDFRMWSGFLEAGGYDVIVAPFTRAKLRSAIRSAAEDFKTRLPERPGAKSPHDPS
jgi:DNA-binding NtrC family response regulator